jgi:hypothetical protein
LNILGAELPGKEEEETTESTEFTEKNLLRVLCVLRGL